MIAGVADSFGIERIKIEAVGSKQLICVAGPFLGTREVTLVQRLTPFGFSCLKGIRSDTVTSMQDGNISIRIDHHPSTVVFTCAPVAFRIDAAYLMRLDAVVSAITVVGIDIEFR